MLTSFLLEKRKEDKENQIIVLRYRVSPPAGMLCMQAQARLWGKYLVLVGIETISSPLGERNKVRGRGGPTAIG